MNNFSGSHVKFSHLGIIRRTSSDWNRPRQRSAYLIQVAVQTIGLNPR